MAPGVPRPAKPGKLIEARAGTGELPDFDHTDPTGLRLVVLALLYSFSLVSASLGAPVGDSLRIYVRPAEQCARAGDTVQITIAVSPIGNLYAAGCDLDYDVYGVRVLHAAEGPFLSSGGTVNTVFSQSNDESKGRLLLGTTRTNYLSGGASCAVDTVLFHVSFEILAPGVHSLTISKSSLIAPDGQTHYEHTASSGIIDASATAVEDFPTTPALPDRVQLEQNYPNPFNATTKIAYALPRQDQVTIEIINNLGQVVMRFAIGEQAPGRYTVAWDSRADGGKQVASGVYFYRITTRSFSDTKKMALLK